MLWTKSTQLWTSGTSRLSRITSRLVAHFRSISWVFDSLFERWQFLQDRTKNAQFVIISLRNNMFELGDRLIGIYKVRMEIASLSKFFNKRPILDTRPHAERSA